jgi:methionyl-tRNA formyltransferase
MDRLVIFADAHLFSTEILIQEIFRIIKNREDIAIVGVIDTARSDSPIKVKRIFHFLFGNIAVKIFNPELEFPIRTTSANNLYDICRKFNIKVIIPPYRDINNQAFVNYLRDSARPTLGLSIGCLQIFRKPLINIFEIFVNYHDGLLPQYRGLSATRWSRYRNEKNTGFTYHLINEGIDDGNILIQDTIPIPESIPFFELEHRKTIRASMYLEKVINLMLDRSNGVEQKGQYNYFDKKDFDAITTIDNPSQLTFNEIDKRLRVFGALKFNMNGNYYSITKFNKRATSGKDGLKSCFLTKDNIVIEPTRIFYLPVPFYKFYRFIRRMFGK